MVEGLIAIAQGALGVATFAAIYLYVFVIFPIMSTLERWPLTRDWPRARRDWAALLLWAAGALGLWLIVRFVLPEWWVEATPSLTPE